LRLLKTSIKKVWVTCISEELLLILSWRNELFLLSDNNCITIFININP
jgi:hypothetical protein